MQNFAIRIWLIVCCLVVIGCKRPNLTNGSDVKYFSENSRRRQATDAEAGAIAIMRLRSNPATWCTAFAVSSTSNRNIYATARHCANYNLAAACEKDLYILPAKSENAAESRCIRVLAEDAKLDFALFEVEKSVTKTALRLASFDPPLRTRLKMIGYPTGPLSPAEPWKDPLVTDNCWIMGEARATSVSNADKALDFKVIPNNCTTYGGNSGGPITIEGTDIAVGMPFFYFFTDYVSKSWDSPISGELHTSRDFIAAFKAKVIPELGIITVDTMPPPTYPTDYLAVSKCTAPTGKILPIDWLVPNYNSTDQLYRLDIMFSGLSAKISYPCSGQLCVLDGQQIKIVNPQKIIMTLPAGQREEYSCERI